MSSGHSTPNREPYSELTSITVDLTTRYEDGFLPGPGGWLDQDWFFVMLIQEGLASKRERERIEERRREANIKLAGKRR